MCGICGIVHTRPESPISDDQLVRMRDSMTHRGPDEAGVLMRPHVGLGHRRLSIIDLSPAGRQPMTNEDETIWVVCNGEIYNFQEIREDLLSRGHRFRSNSDSEVLLHLYEEEGDRLVERLRGMFAFAIWDSVKRRLLIARDRFGIKPLYYAEAGDGFLFGSEIKALLASGLIPATPDPGGISEYLANRYTTGTQTLFQGVSRLLPAHTAVWENGTVTFRRYWAPPAGLDIDRQHSESELVERFSELFEESVRLRMISDAPIGVFLSGGIDSSAIASVMARHSADPIRTYSVAFEERGANELPYARAVAEALGATHREVVVSPGEYFKVLEKLIWHEDEPIAFPSSIPLYFVSRLATEDVKVVLTGEGSDEMFAGYGKYWRALYMLRAGAVYEHLPAGVRRGVRNLVESLPRQRFTNRLRRTFLARPNDVEHLYLQNFSVFNRAMQMDALTPEFLESARDGADSFDPFLGHRKLLNELSDLPILEQLLVLDWQTYLHELLMKQDQMSMAASLESRVPFLDHILAEFAATLPPALKLKGLTTKRIVRLAMRDQVPKVVLTRPKMGFPTPFGTWLRDRAADIIDGVILSEEARNRGIFDFDYIERIVQEHGSGAVDHTERLWALTNLELWYRNCVDGAGQAPEASVGDLVR